MKTRLPLWIAGFVSALALTAGPSIAGLALASSRAPQPPTPDFALDGRAPA